MPVPWNSSKAKVQLRLSVQRLRTLQQKKEAQAKSARRDIATILERGRVETAKVKVESVINEDIHVELLELLELYCELLLARFGLLDQQTQKPDPSIVEAVSAIIYSAQRTELKELHILRDMLMQKYGREFSQGIMDNKANCVSDRVVRKCDLATPDKELVDAYLTEIARAYGVNWVSSSSQPVPKNEDAGPEGGVAVKPSASESQQREGPILAADLPCEEKRNEKGPAKESEKTGTSANRKVREEDDFEALAKRFEALKKK